MPPELLNLPGPRRVSGVDMAPHRQIRCMNNMEVMMNRWLEAGYRLPHMFVVDVR